MYVLKMIFLDNGKIIFALTWFIITYHPGCPVKYLLTLGFS